MDIEINNLKLLYNKIFEFKEKGNKEFLQDDKSIRAVAYYHLAIELYDKHYKRLSVLEDSIENERTIFKVLGMVCSNLALIYLNQNQIGKALKFSNRGIEEFDSNGNSKLYYRNSISKKLLCHYQESLEQIEKAIEIEKRINLSSSSSLIKSYESEKKELEFKIEKSIKEELNFEKRMKKDEKYFKQFENNCSIIYKQGYGRAFKSNRAMEKGEILFRVAPFASALEYEYLFNSCEFCLQTIEGDQYEINKEYLCSKCKLQVICKRCRNLKGNVAVDYHNEICDFLAFLHQNHKDSIEESRDFRFMIRVFSNICNARNKNKDSRNPTIYSGEMCNDGRAPYISDDHTDFINLARVTKTPDKEQFEKFKRGVNSIYNLISSVRGVDYWKNLSKSEMLTYYFTVMTNALGFNQPLSSEIFGRGIVPTGSYFNHSCVSNTEWFIDDQGMVVFTTSKPVEKDEELFSNYTPTSETLEIRRKDLLEVYSFFCQCKLCEFQNNLTGMLCKQCEEPLLEDSVQYHEPINSNDTGLSFMCGKCNQIESIEIKSKEEKLKEIEDSIEFIDKRTFSQIKFFQSILDSRQEFHQFKSMLPVDRFNQMLDQLPSLYKESEIVLIKKLIDSMEAAQSLINQIPSFKDLKFSFDFYYYLLFKELRINNYNNQNKEELEKLKKFILANIHKSVYNSFKNRIDNSLNY